MDHHRIQISIRLTLQPTKTFSCFFQRISFYGPNRVVWSPLHWSCKKSRDIIKERLAAMEFLKEHFWASTLMNNRASETYVHVSSKFVHSEWISLLWWWWFSCKMLLPRHNTVNAITLVMIFPLISIPHCSPHSSDLSPQPSQYPLYPWHPSGLHRRRYRSPDCADGDRFSSPG